MPSLQFPIHVLLVLAVLASLDMFSTAFGALHFLTVSPSLPSALQIAWSTPTSVQHVSVDVVCVRVSITAIVIHPYCCR
jgi:hypothetical protein